MCTTDKEVLNYIDDFYKDPSDPLERFRADCERHHVPIIKRETQSFLGMLLCLNPPNRILEVGTGVGYSSVFFARTIPKCEITTLELIDKRYIEANINVEKYGFSDRINIIEGDASETLSELSRSGETYDFVFIDSAKSRYRDFYSKGHAMMPEGGIIVCDNILLDGRTASDLFISKHREKTSVLKMRKFIDFLKSFDGAESHLFNVGDGLIVSTVKQYSEI